MEAKEESPEPTLVEAGENVQETSWVSPLVAAARAGEVIDFVIESENDDAVIPDA